ncbi:MAG: hypothetical protein MI923_28240 [Phycisphaerales bacterium]|nr:hypothetical protein [Phycisphaerales bacterium]
MNSSQEDDCGKTEKAADTHGGGRRQKKDPGNQKKTWKEKQIRQNGSGNGIFRRTFKSKRKHSDCSRNENLLHQRSGGAGRCCGRFGVRRRHF